jgi:thiol-disulfide isomerase/thioredoxin
LLKKEKGERFMGRQPIVYLMFSITLAIWTLGIGQSEVSATGRRAPEFTNDTWINSTPLRLAELKGKVVLVEFWTFGCYNCQNVEPYVKSWHDKFKDQGLVVIAVHSPEFGHERVLKNVRNYVREHNIQYAVAVDNDFKIWKSYQNRYWPAMYLIDKQGVIRYMRIGEGGYNQTEKQIRDLLAER